MYELRLRRVVQDGGVSRLRERLRTRSDQGELERDFSESDVCEDRTRGKPVRLLVTPKQLRSEDSGSNHFGREERSRIH